jgi:MFS family permease
MLHGLSSAYRDLFSFMRPNWRFFAYHYAGFTLAAVAMTGCAIWYPAQVGRTFGWGPAQIGMGLGGVMILSGVGGKLVGGFAVDAMIKRGKMDAQLRWFATCMLLATPIGVFAMTRDDVWLFLIGAGIFATLLATLPACSAAALNMVTPNELRGTGVALFAATAGLIGSASGPILIAAVAEHGFGGPQFIGLGMACIIAIFCPIGAWLLLRGCAPMRAAMPNPQL